MKGVVRYTCVACGYQSRGLATGKMLSCVGDPVFACGACKDLFAASQAVAIEPAPDDEALLRCPVCQSAEAVSLLRGKSDQRAALRGIGGSVVYPCPNCGAFECRQVWADRGG